MEMIEKQWNWIPYELKSKDVDFAAYQRSVQCCQIVENLFGNVKMGGLTPPAIVSRRYSFRLPFVSIDDTRPGISALMKKSKNWSIRGMPQKTHRFFEMVSDSCQKDEEVVASYGQYFES